MIQLHIEPGSYCNARCRFCVYRSTENLRRHKGRMDMALYHRLIDEAATIPEITEVAFSGLNEPLLDDRIFERIGYAKAVRPGWIVEMFTNGVYLTPGTFDILKRVKLDGLSISLNATTPEEHEEIMGLHGQFFSVCENIDYAREHRGTMVIRVKAVYDGTRFNEKTAERFIQRWGHVGARGDGQPVYEMNWAAQLDHTTIKGFDPNEGCARALGQISVLWDGRVSLCCLDPFGHTVFGDLNAQSLRDIYNSEAYVRFRELHDQNRVNEHPTCRNCTRV